MGFRDFISGMVHRLIRVREVDVSGHSVNGQADGNIPGRLPKCLTTFDLISLGVGSCMGTGMYVVSGLVAREMAGPGVILSFIIAAMASILSGVCYAEFGVRVPQTTGSAYMYSYVTVGEFVAFVIGWNLILEYLIGTAAGASAISSCIDALLRNRISTFLKDNVSGFGLGEDTYPDIVALIICVVITLVVAAGAKKSVTFNNVLNSLNLANWVFIIVAGLFFINGANWTVHGFLPYGFSGVMTGAATCFYAFIGFDIIATTGEEAKNPSRSIPIAIMLSLLTCLIGYVTVSCILTLAVPFYNISDDSPLMDMFVQNMAEPGKYIVFAGSMAGLSVSLLGSIFPMPRVIYAMAVDGLLFRSLAKINHVTHTPALATVISGFLAAIMALLVTLRDLIEMMSIGTLLAYTLVSMCVLILRYQPHVEVKTALGDYDTLDEDGEGWGSSQVPSRDHEPSSSSEAQATLHEAGVDKLLPKLQTDGSHTEKSFYGALDDDTDRFFNYSQSDLMRSRAREWIYGNLEEARIKLGLPASTEFPTAASGRSVTISVFTLFVLIFMLCFVVVVFNESLGQLWIVIFMSVVITLIAGLIINIIRLPQNPEKLKFMAPGLPYLPLIAMFINIFLMLKLNKLTWVRFAIWMSIGLLIYFGYGMWNSSIEGRTNYNRRRSNTGKDKMVVDNNKVQMEVEASVIPAHVKKEDEKSPEESSGFETE